MKLSTLVLSLLATLVVSHCWAAPKQPDEPLLVQPKPDNAMLINPGKGWVQYGGPDDTYTKNYVSIGYNRFTWAEIQPAEHQFNWKPIDDCIQSFKRYGKKTAIGVMNVSTGIGHQYVTPKWVFDAGAEPLSIADASTPTGRQMIPKHWDDPIFLQKMQAFIQAFGARYDGSADIAFVDIRDYGNWGEGHTGLLGNDPSTILTPPENLKNNYLLPYIQAFPHSQLIVPWGNQVYNSVYEWAVSRGAGIRRDGILSQWTKDGSECLPAYGHAPAVFEYCDSYSVTKKKGYWGTEALMHDIKTGRPSYMQWDAQIFQENSDFCLNVGNKIGYHFVLQQALIPRRITSGQIMKLQLRWLNDGVAYLYEPCQVAIGLLDGNNHVVQKQWVAESSPRTWTPGKSTTESIHVAFPGIPGGSYRLAIALFADRKSADPTYQLGIEGRTSNGWYVLSDHVRVKAK